MYVFSLENLVFVWVVYLIFCLEESKRFSFFLKNAWLPPLFGGLNFLAPGFLLKVRFLIGFVVLAQVPKSCYTVIMGAFF